MRTVLLVLVVLALVPSALAQEPVNGCARQCSAKASDVNFPPVVEWGGKVNVIQYAHMEDILNSAPLNTIPPDPAFEEDLNRGFMVPSLSARTPFKPADFNFKNNGFTFFQCPGTVEPTEKGWLNGCHGRGLADDVTLAGREIPVYFYVSPATGLEPVGVGVMPNIRFFAQMMTGHREGSIIAQSPPGESSTILLSRPGQDDVFELRTVMKAHMTYIPTEHADARSRGYRVEVAVYQYRDQTVEAQQKFHVRSGPSFPPRIILPVLDPVAFLDDFRRTSNGTIEYFVRVTSDFGSYDVDRANATARLHARGLDLTRHLAGPVVKNYSIYDHDGSAGPVMFRYTVDAKSIQVEGPLVFDFSVPNRQGTYVLHHATELPFARFNDAEVIPGLPLTGFLALLGAVSLLRRRIP